MIERLMKENTRYGEPEYSRAGEAISQAIQSLSAKLDQDGWKLLSQVEEAYQAREAAVIRSTFQEGFCAAVRLALEVLEHSHRDGGICH